MPEIDEADLIDEVSEGDKWWAWDTSLGSGLGCMRVMTPGLIEGFLEGRPHDWTGANEFEQSLVSPTVIPALVFYFDPGTEGLNLKVWFTAPDLADDDFQWRHPDGTIYHGKGDSDGWAWADTAGAYAVSCSDWTQVDDIYIEGLGIKWSNADRLLELGTLEDFSVQDTQWSPDISGWNPPTNLQMMKVQAYETETQNATGDVTHWTLPDSIKQVRLPDLGIEGDIGHWVLGENDGSLSASLDVSDNPDITGDVSSWEASKVQTMYIDGTSLYGDVSSWAGPPAEGFNAENANLSGDISGWVFTHCFRLNMDLAYNDVEGDIGVWDLTNDIRIINVHWTNVSGDISGWDLSSGGGISGIEAISVADTSVSGDSSQITLPEGNSLSIWNAANCSLDYDNTSGMWVNAADGITIYLQGNNMTEAQVDNVLADLVTSGAENGTLNIAGDNAAPSADGDDDVSTLQGCGWSVSTS